LTDFSNFSTLTPEETSHQMSTHLSTARVKCNHCTLLSETNTLRMAKKRGHPASAQTPWKLHDWIEWEYCRYFLAYLLIIVCFYNVTPMSHLCLLLNWSRQSSGSHIGLCLN